MRLTLLILTVLLISMFDTFAKGIKINDQVYLELIMRYRLEIDDRVKYFNIDEYHSEINETEKRQSPNEYNTLRTQLGLCVKLDENVKLYTKFQDSRFLGTTESNRKSSSTIELHEAYLEINKIFNSPFALQLGRYEMDYGCGRVIGSNDWEHYGPRAFDGIRIKLDQQSWFIHFFASKLWDRGHYYQVINEWDNPYYYEVSRYYKWDKNLVGFSGSFFNRLIQPIIFLIHDRESQEFDDLRFEIRNWLYTAGVFHQMSMGRVYLESEFYYQYGAKYHDLFWDRRYKSIFASIHVEKEFNIPNKPYLGFGIDIISGRTDFDYISEFGKFYSPLGSSFDFNGYMYHLSNFDGLNDFYVKTGIQVTKFSANLDFHIFRARAKRSLEESEFRFYRNIGSELDVHLQYELYENFFIDSAFCYFWPGSEWKSDDTENSSFFYLSFITKL